MDIQIEVLGTKYSVEMLEEGRYEEKRDGGINFNYNKILVNNYKNKLSEKVLRHELIHAFLHESGLCEQCRWSLNEEMIDWFALQWNKIDKAIKEVQIVTQGGRGE